MGLEIKDICYSYSSKFGIKDISADFGNHITTIIGPNGSGKSTLLKCITNQYKWSGAMFYDNADIHPIDKRFFRTKLSYLPQSSENFSTITVFEAVLLGLINELSMRVTPEQERQVQECLRLLELESIAFSSISELSGGQLQMVLLAQAIIKKPEILILDEPLNNLDIHRQFSFLDYISKLTYSSRMVTIIVMHDINLAARYAQSIMVMMDGKVYSQGPPCEIITRKMIREIYSLDCNIYENKQCKTVVEFTGLPQTL